MAEENGQQEASITTPIGGASFKGKRIAELIAIFSFSALLLLGYVLWEHKERTNTHETMLISALKELATAQREMTCIISIPQEKREAQFTSSDSFCKRIARAP